MHKTLAEALVLIEAMLPDLSRFTDVDRLVCPPSPALAGVAKRLEKSGIYVGAQNMHWEDAGAFTGEISPLMVKEHCQFVIVGHSERRAYFGETDETVNRRVLAALRHDLTPIICIGETLPENEAGQTNEVVARQLREGLKGLNPSQAAGIMIAYEPVWAIGTGKAATPEGANHVVGNTIRETLKEILNLQIAQECRVLYGGSVKPHNAAAFFSQPDIDGALVGGASLRGDDFLAIVAAAGEGA
jgi:triosephosphate isomerase